MRLLAARGPEIVPVGLGYQRSVLGRRSDACRLRRDELGIFLHSVDCRTCVRRGRRHPFKNIAGFAARNPAYLPHFRVGRASAKRTRRAGRRICQ